MSEEIHKSSISKTIETMRYIKEEFGDWLSFKGLIGLTVISHGLSQDNSSIFFKLKDDEHNVIVVDYIVSTCGGNSAWIESIDGIEEILGHKIININNHDGDSIGDRVPYGLIFNIEIVTKKGSCVIDFRSNCNGHYGANLSLISIKINDMLIYFR